MKNHKKIITLSLCSLTLFSCKNDKAEQEEKVIDYAVLSGRIDNSAGGPLLLSNSFDSSLDTLQLKEDGSFADTVAVEAGHYLLIHDRTFQPLYLEPGFELNANFDVKNFDSTLTFAGSGAEANRYLLEKTRKQNKFRQEGRSLYELKEEEFQQKVKEQKDQLVQMLQQTNLPEEYRQLEERNIHYAYIVSLINYGYYNAPPSEDGSHDYKPTAAFQAEIEELEYENVEDYLFSSDYRGLVSNHFSEEAKTLEERDSVPAGLSYLKAVSKLLNDTIRNSLLFDRARYGITMTDDLESYYKTFMAASTNKVHKDEVTESYKVLKKIEPGNPSPDFSNYENYEGGVTSLSDLKGKYLYLDIWATWCGPCIAEIPALKKVEEEFHDQNIEFVSISIDTQKDKEKWRKMVEEKELGGIQLFADNAFDSRFIKDYLIMGIPKFILLDPEGNIVDPNAPRPSNPELTTLLKSLKI